MSYTGENLSIPKSTTALPNHTSETGLARQLRVLITEAVATTSADGILLSGGLDTSILASAAADLGWRLRAISVSIADCPGPDEPCANLMAARLKLELEIIRPQLRDLVEKMPEAIRLLQTFDPMELRNSIVTFAALEAARTRGIKGVLTGDSADELFAGYSYMFKMPAEKLLPYIHHLNEVMHFTSLTLGPALGVKVELPYLADPVREFALSLSAADLVGERDGQRFGKKILREALADVLPDEIAWRVKTPIEYGSGSTALRQLASESLRDAEFESERQRIAAEDGVQLRDKEQCFYYRIYRPLLGPPRELEPGPKECGQCLGPVERLDQRYCRICGAYPI